MSFSSSLFSLLLLALLVLCVDGFRFSQNRFTNKVQGEYSSVVTRRIPSASRHFAVDPKDNNTDVDDSDETVKKYGFEAGLFKSVTSKDSKVKPQDLLAKYGIAYLVTSISFAIVSYAFFYVLVANGVDVGSLLEKVGITSTAVATNTGTAAIAYALHKAASPIRFPPTVLLTPVVAGWLGKKPVEENK